MKQPALLTPNNQSVFLYDGSAFASADAFFFDSYRAELAVIADREPDAQGNFGVYLDDRKLIYLKAPCTAEDQRGIFFLHVVPAHPSDLPAHRAELDFDNLDFIFLDRGVAFDGKCLVQVQLPSYAIVSAATGQYFVGEEGMPWRVDLDLAMDAIAQK